MRRRALVPIAATLVALAMAVPAAAHDPIFLTADQTEPEVGPYLPDATVSFAIYGTLEAAGERRGFQAAFAAGDLLVVELLVPDRAPERSLDETALPVATVTAPDGTAATLSPELRERFDEPFSRTSYLRLATLRAEAQAGVYDVEITGAAPARFTVAVGTQERFGTPVERVPNRAAGFGAAAEALAAWYQAEPAPAAPAGQVPVAGAAALGSAVVLSAAAVVRRWFAGRF